MEHAIWIVFIQLCSGRINAVDIMQIHKQFCVKIKQLTGIKDDRPDLPKAYSLLNSTSSISPAS